MCIYKYVVLFTIIVLLTLFESPMLCDLAIKWKKLHKDWCERSPVRTCQYDRNDHVPKREKVPTFGAIIVPPFNVIVHNAFWEYQRASVWLLIDLFVNLLASMVGKTLLSSISQWDARFKRLGLMLLSAWGITPPQFRQYISSIFGNNFLFGSLFFCFKMILLHSPKA